MLGIRVFFILLSITIGNLGFAYYAYVPDLEAGAVFVIDTTTNTVLGTVSTGTFPPFSEPSCVVSSLNGNITYVGDSNNDALYLIDTNPNSGTFNTVIAMIAVPESASPFSMALTPDGTTIYISTIGAIYVFDTSSAAFTGAVTGLAMSPEILGIAVYVDGSYAYATDATTGIYVIDTTPSSGTYNTVINTISDMFATSVVFSPNGEVAFISFTDSMSGAVFVFGADPTDMSTWNMIVEAINPESYTAFIEPVALAISPDGNSLFILDPGNQCIYTADTGTYEVIQLTSVALQTSPPFFTAVGVVPDGSAVYITPGLPQINAMDPTNYNLTTVTNTTSTPITLPLGVSFVAPASSGPRAFQRPCNRR